MFTSFFEMGDSNVNYVHLSSLKIFFPHVFSIPSPVLKIAFFLFTLGISNQQITPSALEQEKVNILLLSIIIFIEEEKEELEVGFGLVCFLGYQLL